MKEKKNDWKRDERETLSRQREKEGKKEENGEEMRKTKE